MKSLLVTVYIPNYNYGQYIEQAVESVLAQTFQDFEIIIIDDGSTDNSKEIIEKYRSNPKIKILYQQNLGLNRTNNVAIKIANGKYIMRLDADDYLSPSALGIMSALLESDAEIGLIYPDYYYVDSSGNLIGEEYRQNVEREVTLFDLPAHGACTMVRLDYLEKLGGYNESFTCQDGYDLWIKFVTNCKVTNINKPLFYYRQHGYNLTLDETNILSTRRKIKDAYIDDFKLKRPRSLAIIPTRNYTINNESWLLQKHDNTTILEKLVNQALTAKNVEKVVITTSDNSILDRARSKYEDSNAVYIIKRPKEFEQFNIGLNSTYELVIKTLKEKGFFDFDVMVSLATEFPFITSDVIDDAINTINIFKTDSVIAVKPDYSTYYRHSGHGMQPILDQDKFTKYERDALYKRFSAVVATTTDNFINNNSFISGRIGHIIIEQKITFEIKTSFQWQLYNMLLQLD